MLVMAMAVTVISACAGSRMEEITGRRDLPPDSGNLSIKEILSLYYKDKPLYIGVANHYKLIGQLSEEIMKREFTYVTPSNDFKQSEIHPDPNKWRWERSDGWIRYCNENGMILRIHGPISPQSSKWAKGDERTPEELRKNMEEYLVALYTKYGSEKSVRWVDVVNETIAVEKFDGYKPGDWFGPRSGVDKWENPWTIVGTDTSTPLNVPTYIDKSFELANRYAPNVKQIINQHGDFEEVVWERMKELYSYLTKTKGRRVDGIGWQAHIDMGWEKIPGNMERLSSFVDWCHANKLEFHITEFNVWLKGANANKYEEQAQTYAAIVKLLLSKLESGTIGINFWNVRDEDTINESWKGTLWNNDGTAKPAYYRIKEVLIENRNLKN